MDETGKNLQQKQKVVEKRMEAAEEMGKEVQEARKEFHEEIRKAKRIQWVEEGKSVWDIVRVARKPFNLQTKCTKIEDEQGEIHREDGGIAAAFVKHNIITEAREGEEETEGPTRRRQPSDMAMKRVRRALSRTKNKSAPGPDGISWRLLKVIKESALGQAALEDIALWASPKERAKTPKTAWEMVMVMILKPGSDHQKVKGWGPIVLANTVRKLGEKLIAEDLQGIEGLRHERSFAGRRGREVMDSVMLMDQLRRKHPGKDVHGRDIHSASNSIDTKIMCDLIKDEHLKSWLKDFLALRSFQIKTKQGSQGSPLSPSVFTIYMSAMVKRGEELDEDLQRERNSRYNLQYNGKPPLTRSFESLQFIDDCNYFVHGNVKDMYTGLSGAAEE